MILAAVAVQNKNGGPISSTVLPPGSQVPLDVGPHCVKGVQLKENFTSGDDYAPKVRKAYTITKQRERWTEDEHKKFLEALKLYGRAWRRIEEHVGTKTAVQIRSHAQKFFSKVVRESSTSDASSVKPIEIPPPRPKRKPMHPYPRKFATPLKTTKPFADQPTRSVSSNSSISEHENQSPTLVLSAIGSETFVTTDSDTPNGSPPAVSSVPIGVKRNIFSLSEPNSSLEENGSPSTVQVDASLTEHVPVKLELFPEENVPTRVSKQSLKLFGKTVVITGSQTPSSQSAGSGCNSPSPDFNDVKPAQEFAWNVMQLKVSPCTVDGSWSSLNCKAPPPPPPALYYMKFPSENSNKVESSSNAFLPWWSYNWGVPFPFPQLHDAVASKTMIIDSGDNTMCREVQKEGSWTGSNTGSGNGSGGSGDRNSDVDTESCRFSVGEDDEQELTLGIKLTEKATSLEQRTNPDKFSKGFVPYKRCLAERDTQSSTLTGEEREEQRVRLFL